MGIAYGANYGRPSLDLNFARNKSLIDTISGQNLVTFSRSQANYLTTYVGSDGLIKYASADEPRFDHNPVTGESLGLLIEESRTNLITYSDDFRNTADAGSTRPWRYFDGTLSSNSTTAPDGTLTADKFIPTSSNTTHYIDAGASPNTTANVIYSFSIFAKSAGLNTITIQNSFGGITAGITVNLSNGSSTTNVNAGTIYSATTQSFPDGWWKINLVSSISNNGYTVIYAGGLSAFSGDGTSGIYIWGAQLEAATFPTSYIPTTGSQVIRSADQASITGTNFSRWYNQSEGTLFTKRSATQTTAGNFVPEWQICGASDNGPQLLDGLLFNNSSSFMSVNNFSAGSTAVAMKSNNFASSFNGGAVTTNTTEPMQTGRTFIRIGRQIGGNTTMMTTRFSRLTYYPTRLQNFQLQQLTK